MLDASLAPEGRHILHIFTTSPIEDWKVILIWTINFAQLCLMVILIMQYPPLT